MSEIRYRESRLGVMLKARKRGIGNVAVVQVRTIAAWPP